jgi:hypothetical protein
MLAVGVLLVPVKIYKTINGGLSWQEQATGTQGNAKNQSIF